MNATFKFEGFWNIADFAGELGLIESIFHHHGVRFTSSLTVTPRDLPRDDRVRLAQVNADCIIEFDEFEELYDFVREFFEIDPDDFYLTRRKGSTQFGEFVLNL